MSRQTPQDVFATATLAGLYFDQGAYREAAEIYKKRLLNNPSDRETQLRLEESLEAMKGESALSSLPAKKVHQHRAGASQLAYLRTWLNRIQRERRL